MGSTLCVWNCTVKNCSTHNASNIEKHQGLFQLRVAEVQPSGLPDRGLFSSHHKWYRDRLCIAGLGFHILIKVLVTSSLPAPPSFESTFLRVSTFHPTISSWQFHVQRTDRQSRTGTCIWKAKVRNPNRCPLVSHWLQLWCLVTPLCREDWEK